QSCTCRSSQGRFNQGVNFFPGRISDFTIFYGTGILQAISIVKREYTCLSAGTGAAFGHWGQWIPLYFNWSSLPSFHQNRDHVPAIYPGTRIIGCYTRNDGIRLDDVGNSSFYRDITACGYCGGSKTKAEEFQEIPT